MTHQFEHEPINDCRKTKAKCLMFEFVCDGGYCNLSRKWCQYLTRKEVEVGDKND